MPDDTKSAVQERLGQVAVRRSPPAPSLETQALEISPDSTTAELQRQAADLYGRLYRRLTDVAKSMCSPDDVPDIIHDAFALYWLRLTSGDARKVEAATKEPEAMLVMMVRDAAYADNRRHLRRLRKIVIMITGPVRAVKRWMEPARRAEDAEIRSIVERELHAMRAIERDVFVLAHHHDFSPDVIGRWCGLQPSSVRKELSRATHKLRTRLIAAGYVRKGSASKALKQEEVA